MVTTRTVERRGKIDFPDSLLSAISCKVGDSVDLDILDSKTLSVRKHGTVTPPPPPPPPPPDTTAPSTPTGLKATPTSQTQIDLSWNKNPETDIATYRVMSNAVEIGNTLPATTTFSNTGLTANSQHSYGIIAVDKAGNKSPMSPIVSATTLPVTPPPPPPPVPVTNVYDNFDQPTFDFKQNGTKSPNLKWLLEYGIHAIGDDSKGYAKIENGQLHMRPLVEDRVTHSVLVRSTAQWANAKYSFDMKLGARNWTSPESWHSVWFFFRHQNHYRHMYGVLKTTGFEFGKKDVPDGTPQPTVELNQRFTYQNNNFKVVPGKLHHVDLEVIGFNPTVKIWLDGVFVGQYTDDGTLSDGKGLIPKPTYGAGEFCLYTEDAEGFYDNIVVEQRL